MAAVVHDVRCAAIMQARCGSQRLSRGSRASSGVGPAPTPSGGPRSWLGDELARNRPRRPDRAVLVSPELGAGARVARRAGDRRQPDRDPEPHRSARCSSRSRWSRSSPTRPSASRSAAASRPSTRARTSIATSPSEPAHPVRLIITANYDAGRAALAYRHAFRTTAALCAGSSATARPAGSHGSPSRPRGCWRPRSCASPASRSTTVGAVQLIPTIGLRDRRRPCCSTSPAPTGARPRTTTQAASRWRCRSRARSTRRHRPAWRSTWCSPAPAKAAASGCASICAPTGARCSRATPSSSAIAADRRRAAEVVGQRRASSSRCVPRRR